MNIFQFHSMFLKWWMSISSCQLCQSSSIGPPPPSHTSNPNKKILQMRKMSGGNLDLDLIDFCWCCGLQTTLDSDERGEEGTRVLSSRLPVGRESAYFIPPATHNSPNCFSRLRQCSSSNLSYWVKKKLGKQKKIIKLF
jgi:hypothetical protein